MIDTTKTKIKKLVIHRVGNKIRNEKYTQSDSLVEITQDLEQILLNYFLTPFIGNDEVYNFTHSSNINFNEVYQYSKDIFSIENNFLKESNNILVHLYNQSLHPKIIKGDLFIVLFDNIKIDNKITNALGIFKSEKKDTFIKTISNKKYISLYTEKGINTKQLEKGCLIFNTFASHGYKILTIDINKYDTQYWIDDFMNISNSESSNHITKNYLTLCKEFSDEYSEFSSNKKEKVLFLNKSLSYFSCNAEFEINDFSNSVFSNNSISQEFKKFKSDYEVENDILFDKFNISKTALKNIKRAFKNFIKLDTQIEVKLNFTDPHLNSKFIERGYDENKKMFFYKIYFNKELE